MYILFSSSIHSLLTEDTTISSINDKRMQALLSALSLTSGDLPSLWKQWLVARTSLSAKLDIPTIELYWLNSLGYTTGTLDDRWNRLLNALGYSGDLSTKLLRFWTAGVSALLPGAPTSLNAVTASSTQIDLTWVAPASVGASAITGYFIERKVGAGAWATLVANTGTTSVTYSDTGLTASTLYTYRVSAITAAGTGTASSEDSDTTSSGSFALDAVKFDPTSDALIKTAELTGAADGKKVTFSAWVFFDDNPDTLDDYLFSGYHSSGKNPPLCYIMRNRTTNGGMLQAFFSGVGTSTPVCNFSATSAENFSTGWHHMAVSVDLTDTNKRHVYWDGSALAGTWGTYTNANMDFTMDRWNVGARDSVSGFLGGGIAEVFFHTDYMDLSQASNLQKFRSAGGLPVNLGSDGSTPFGVQPLIYLHLDDGETVNNFAVNAGSGGNFTVTGTIDTYEPGPADSFPAFPAVASYDLTAALTNASDEITGVLPSGIQVGDLLVAIAFFKTKGDTLVLNWSTGWTSVESNAAVVNAIEVRYRVATGSDTAPTIRDMGLPGGGIAAKVWIGRITGAATSPVAIGKSSSASATSTAPNSSTVTAAGGRDSNLYLTFYCTGASGTPSAYPYAYGLNQASNPSYSFSAGIAARKYNSASDDAAAFTIVGSQAWRAYGLVVER